jgi:hypothetical protein
MVAVALALPMAGVCKTGRRERESGREQARQNPSLLHL